MTEYALQVRNLSKRYGSLLAVDDISFDVEQGSFATILGPSGCGKTTTLRMIAGFVQPDAGTVTLNGQEVQNTPPYRRQVNTVFQSYALFPHMTARENIAYGLHCKKISAAEIDDRVSEALKLIDMPDHGARYPRQMSGGQMQRVALARAFINEPDLLLLDEPLGALDLKLRGHMQTELKRLQQDLGIAFLYVTHDQGEALTMSDQVIVMNHSVIEQNDHPVKLYNEPKTAFIAQFLGGANLIKPERVKITKGGASVEFCGIKAKLNRPFDNLDGPEPMIAIRPEKLKLEPHPDKQPIVLDAKVTGIVFKGTNYDISVALNDGTDLVATAILDDLHCQVGDQISLGVAPDDIILVKSDFGSKP